MLDKADSQPPEFHVKIASTGDVLGVPKDKSIVDVLLEHGYRVEVSCSHGLCGTCKTRYLEGEPDHQDMFLNPEEKAEFMTPCVSRSKSAGIVLDLPPPESDQPIVLDRPVAEVDNSICVACLTCVRACNYGAATIDAELMGVGGILGAAIIDAKLCTGCGLCAAACPTGAIGMSEFIDLEINTQMEGFFIPDDRGEAAAGAENLIGAEPLIVVFCCPSSSLSVVEFTQDPSRPVDLKIVQMPCTGRIDNLFLMKAFKNGADGVMVSGCEPGHCYFAIGNLNAEKRVRRVGDWLDDVGLAASRVRMVHLPNDGAGRFNEAVRELANDIRALGPSPLRLPTKDRPRHAAKEEV